VVNIAQNVAQPIFLSKLVQNVYHGKGCPKCATSVPSLDGLDITATIFVDFRKKWSFALKNQFYDQIFP
jgi:hypothetical protein